MISQSSHLLHRSDASTRQAAERRRCPRNRPSPQWPPCGGDEARGAAGGGGLRHMCLGSPGRGSVTWLPGLPRSSWRRWRRTTRWTRPRSSSSTRHGTRPWRAATGLEAPAPDSCHQEQERAQDDFFNNVVHGTPRRQCHRVCGKGEMYRNAGTGTSPPFLEPYLGLCFLTSFSPSPGPETRGRLHHFPQNTEIIEKETSFFVFNGSGQEGALAREETWCCFG